MKREAGSAQYCPMTGQETHIKTHSILPEHIKTFGFFLLRGWLNTVTGFPERL